MSFAPEWLALRDPADRGARDGGLIGHAAQAARDAAGAGVPCVLDLGCGTGASARAFAPHLPEGTCWRLVDHDPALLRLACAEVGRTATAVQADLADLEALPVAGAHLITASALLDLMPQGWVLRLAAWLPAQGVAFHASLSYDGTMVWEPEDPADRAVTDAFNAHQRTDKGLGPALGPDGAAAVARELARAGMIVTTAPSPWRLGPDQAALQDELLAGIAGAAAEMGCPDTGEWLARRRATIPTGTALVGHLDLLALPADPTSPGSRA